MFISHSEKDRWIAHQISTLIKAKGKKYKINTFLYEKDIDGGESIPESIKISIKDCNEFVVLLSRYSIERPWVLIEIGAAWVLEKHITAIIDKVSIKELPDIISSDKAVDLNDFDEFLDQLINRAKK